MPRPMRGHGGQQIEKSKDFAGSMKRLLEHLNPWKIPLYLSLVIAMISAILALITPDKLSNLTDTITKGITPKIEVLGDISSKMFEHLDIDGITKKTSIIMKSSSISKEDKKVFSDGIKNLSLEKSNNEFMEFIISLPDSVLEVLLDEFEINDTVISVNDQIEMINLTSQMKDASNTEGNLVILDKLPKSIYSLVKPTINMNKVKSIAIFMAVLYIVSALLNYIQNFTMTTISNKFAKLLRTNISSK